MKVLHLANRTSELEIFQQIITNQILKKILLIKAPSTLGKTHLLKRFKHECELWQDIVAIPISLKGSEAGIPFILDYISQALGKKCFPDFSAYFESLSGNRINISKNQILWGNQQIDIDINVDEKTHEIQLLNLANYFFEDLNKISSITKIVLLIDSFEVAIPELQKWISNTLLRVTVQEDSKLFVVIAGQEVPNSKDFFWWEDYCECLNLEAITDHKAWHQFSQDIGVMIPEETIDTLTFCLKGNPQIIETALFELRNRKK